MNGSNSNEHDFQIWQIRRISGRDVCTYFAHDIRRLEISRCRERLSIHNKTSVEQRICERSRICQRDGDRLGRIYSSYSSFHLRDIVYRKYNLVGNCKFCTD